MTQKSKNITGWVLTSVLALIFIGSASIKLIGGEASAKGAAAIGLSSGTLQGIAVLELLSILLFIIPRTGLLGTLLLAAYLGGAIATHLEHQQPAVFPAVIQALVWITATLRFPELRSRLMARPRIIPATTAVTPASFARS
jgi:hypothetical protein